MVQSSYKNRKKNRKQSFKRKNTDGNRKVKFIDDDDKKMVGGGDNENKMAITSFMNKYSKHPIYGVLLAIYSNQNCANIDLGNNQCRDDNTAKLGVSYNNSVIIMSRISEVDDKPTAPTGKIENADKLKYVGEVIDYLAQNVFIPTGFIQHVYVQKDDSWKTLKNNNFKETPQEELGKRDAGSNPTANEGKVYAADGIEKIGNIVNSLTDESSQEDIDYLKSLVHKPDNNTGDDFENKVHNLTVDNLKVQGLTGAYKKWSEDKLNAIQTETEGEQNDPDYKSAELQTQMTDIANETETETKSAAVASPSSATTEPQQQEGLKGAHELMIQMDDIANTTGGNNSEKQNNMIDKVRELRPLLKKIYSTENSSEVKVTLGKQISSLDKLFKVKTFDRLSKDWTHLSMGLKPTFVELNKTNKK